MAAAAPTTAATTTDFTREGCPPAARSAPAPATVRTAVSVATETTRRDQTHLLDERDADFDERLDDFERPVDFDERPDDFDPRLDDFDDPEPAFAFEALLRDPEPLDFDELPRELLEPLDFAELREAAVFPRVDPLLEVFEPREELFAFVDPFVDPDAREDLPPERCVLL